MPALELVSSDAEMDLDLVARLNPVEEIAIVFEDLKLDLLRIFPIRDLKDKFSFLESACEGLRVVDDQNLAGCFVSHVFVG